MATITEDYVSFEIAKLLKEKGFLKGVDLRMTQNLSFYDDIGLSHNLNEYYDRLILDEIDFVVAPTLQMAMKWLREVHHIYIGIFPTHNILSDSIDYEWQTYNASYDVTGDSDAFFNIYEEAVEAALKYSLKNLI